MKSALTLMTFGFLFMNSGFASPMNLAVSAHCQAKINRAALKEFSSHHSLENFANGLAISFGNIAPATRTDKDGNAHELKNQFDATVVSMNAKEKIPMNFTVRTLVLPIKINDTEHDIKVDSCLILSTKCMGSSIL